MELGLFTLSDLITGPKTGIQMNALGKLLDEICRKRLVSVYSLS
jgi:hypothetical protein